MSKEEKQLLKAERAEERFAQASFNRMIKKAKEKGALISLEENQTN